MFQSSVFCASLQVHSRKAVVSFHITQLICLTLPGSQLLISSLLPPSTSFHQFTCIQSLLRLNSAVSYQCFSGQDSALAYQMSTKTTFFLTSQACHCCNCSIFREHARGFLPLVKVLWAQEPWLLSPLSWQAILLSSRKTRALSVGPFVLGL